MVSFGWISRFATTPATLMTKATRFPSGFSSVTARIVKISMLYGASNRLYERALVTHRKHAERWGHRFQVLREDITSGFWNKPAFILYSVIEELSKPSDDRAEWLMWVDADSIIINPALSPELFLPPPHLSHIHFIGTRDQNGLNTGIFYLRVSSWSVSFLVDTMALCHTDVDLGRSADQEAMAKVLGQTQGGPRGWGYKDGAVAIPRTWINAYEWHHAYEGSRGDMLVHFPGLEEARWKHMADWLDVVEAEPERWECPLEDTIYWNATREFWREYSSAYHLMEDTELLDDTEKLEPKIRLAFQSLKMSLGLEADNVDKIREAKRELLKQRSASKIAAPSYV